MKRRAIPQIDMIDYGEERLRERGFVAMPFSDSLVKDPRRLRPHYHDFFQISLLNGAGTLMHDFRDHCVDGMTLFFLSPGQVHTISPDEEMTGTVLSFTRDFFESGAESSPGFLLDMPFFFSPEAQPWLALDGLESTRIASLFEEMQQEFDQSKIGALEMLRSLLWILLVRCSRKYAEIHSMTPVTRSAVLVRRFYQQLEKHFHDWPSLRPYAVELGVTINHLNDVVREQTGKAAGEHIRSRRLLDAKRMLLYSELSVSEIGYQLGFQDPSYFNRFFRRYAHSTPLAFRNEIREKYQKEAG
jgi:AraC family transcriptional regulator, transcriptional activator of pobA